MQLAADFLLPFSKCPELQGFHNFTTKSDTSKLYSKLEIKHFDEISVSRLEKLFSS
jgi:hypothetical protein